MREYYLFLKDFNREHSDKEWRLVCYKGKKICFLCQFLTRKPLNGIICRLEMAAEELLKSGNIYQMAEEHEFVVKSVSAECIGEVKI